MSVRTRTVEAPGRVARRVQAAERVKSGAAQRAYARRRVRAEQLDDTPKLPRQRVSGMATRIPFVVAIIALLGCGLAVTLLLTTRAAEDSYQLGDARTVNRKLSEERAALQREVEAADSAPELAARARELGMIPAKDPARIVVAPDGTVIVVGKPTPAEGPPVPPLNGAPPAPSAAQPGHVLAQGERVVPVPTSRPRSAPGQPNTVLANGTQGHTAAPAPTDAVPVAAGPAPVPPPVVPAPIPQIPVAPAPVEAPASVETPLPAAPEISALEGQVPEAPAPEGVAAPEAQAPEGQVPPQAQAPQSPASEPPQEPAAPDGGAQ
ncbi:hypothetical protein [Nocardia australiensis]|uniref:hypothetical protein n=1 Tax=Nocardia australiensis TaxID=2887191 RepID=UPI001D1533B6|nr:hypothetical protein [Nocardia australiensis]